MLCLFSWRDKVVTVRDHAGRQIVFECSNPRPFSCRKNLCHLHLSLIEKRHACFIRLHRESTYLDLRSWALQVQEVSGSLERFAAAKRVGLAQALIEKTLTQRYFQRRILGRRFAALNRFVSMMLMENLLLALPLRRMLIWFRLWQRGFERTDISRLRTEKDQESLSWIWNVKRSSRTYPQFVPTRTRSEGSGL
jgi:hypothetical protein